MIAFVSFIVSWRNYADDLYLISTVICCLDSTINYHFVAVRPSLNYINITAQETHYILSF